MQTGNQTLIVFIETGNEVHSNVTPHPLVRKILWWRMAIMQVSSIFSLKNTLFVCPLPTPTKYGTSRIVSLFRMTRFLKSY